MRMVYPSISGKGFGLFVRKGRILKKLSIVALLLSLCFCGFALLTVDGEANNPYFIDSVKVLEENVEMQAINQKIGRQDEILQKKENSFVDSIMSLYKSNPARNINNDSLVELMNLEGNVYRHNTIDSISKASRIEVDEALKRFNDRVGEYCKKNGISILFGSGNNFIVYGTGTKADKTNDLINYFKGKNE